VKNIVCFVVLSFLHVYATAQTSYDYFEIGYENVRIEKLDSANANFRLSFDQISGYGRGFEGSYSIGESYFVFADFDFTSFDLDSNVVEFLNGNGSTGSSSIGSSVSLSTQVLGVGYHTDGDRQFVAKGALLRRDVNSDFLKEASIGYIAELGFRVLIRKNIEWEVNLGYADPDTNDGPSGKLGGNTSIRYHFSNNFSTDIATSNEKDEKTYSLNLRYNFD